MDRVNETLTVFFEDPFWIGVFERRTGEELSVCRIVFGAEPKEYEIYDFILRHYKDLEFSPPVQSDRKEKADNPKRRQRSARRQVRQTGIGTKSQQALQKQREMLKEECQRRRKEKKEIWKRQKFILKQQKRKEKHKGH